MQYSGLGVFAHATMKLIGLLGGMSWESSAEYYRLINEAVRKRLGGQHSARILLHSLDFQEIERYQHEGDWVRGAARLVEAARSLEAGGADVLLVCTNTMHRVADEIEAAIEIPFLHIADAVGEAVRESGLSTVGLLGTRFTMEQDFYRGRLAERFGLRVVVPDDESRGVVHRIIYDELCLGTVDDGSRDRILGIARELRGDGAEGIVLGCTELPLLIRPEHTDLPLFNTTAIHAHRALEWALEGEENDGSH